MILIFSKPGVRENRWHQPSWKATLQGNTWEKNISAHFHCFNIIISVRITVEPSNCKWDHSQIILFIIMNTQCAFAPNSSKSYVETPEKEENNVICPCFNDAKLKRREFKCTAWVSHRSLCTDTFMPQTSSLGPFSLKTLLAGASKGLYRCRFPP